MATTLGPRFSWRCSKTMSGRRSTFSLRKMAATERIVWRMPATIRTRPTPAPTTPKRVEAIWGSVPNALASGRINTCCRALKISTPKARLLPTPKRTTPSPTRRSQRFTPMPG